MNPHRGNPEDITEAYYRGLMHSVGFRRKDLEKPQIAIINSWTEANPCGKRQCLHVRTAGGSCTSSSHYGGEGRCFEVGGMG